MKNLFTKLTLALSIAAGLTAATTTARAQSDRLMTVNVPFAFTANKVALPAGKYAVRASEHFLSLTNVSTNKTAVVITRNDYGTVNSGPSRLSFRQIQGQTYLAQVWTGGSSIHSELLSHPKPNREIGQVTSPETTFEIATK